VNLTAREFAVCFNRRSVVCSDIFTVVYQSNRHLTVHHNQMMNSYQIM